MRRIATLIPLIPIALILAAFPASAEKEPLTDKEIMEIREAQEIGPRIKIYLEAAVLRITAAEDRLMGNESKAGDPLEFSTPEDMLGGYYRILKSVMFNIDDAFQKPGADAKKLVKALNNLKKTTERCGKELKILKKMAEEAKKEELWNLINKAIDITSAAFEGAELGLAKLPAAKAKAK
jgi:hypothetical protein